VSSAGAGDGKTITATNLAGALAQSPETRVLLVDADLRRPTISDLLGIGDTRGADLVGAMLDPAVTLSRIAHSLPAFNLSVVCAGQPPSSPYELLKAPRLTELMNEARRRYDYVIVDTPPLTPIQDCRLVSQWVDGFLVVVAAHRTPRQLLKDALATVDPVKMLGLVFNQDDRSTAGRYSSYHAAYYSFGELSGNGSRRGVLPELLSTLSGLTPGAARRGHRERGK